MGNGYKLANLSNAVELLRPGSKYCLSGWDFIEWEHEQDPPTKNEINDMIKMLQEWEDNNPELVDKVYV